MMEEKRTEVPETELENEEAKASAETAETENTKKLADELDETKRKYLMMLAEYDNFRKRAQKERESAYGDAYADALTALLPVFDNLERAITFAGDEGMAEGITMIINQFKNALAGMGVESYGEVGDDFDPNLHNAIMQEDNDELGENVISEVFQKGYKRGEKIIRFAMVKVANCG
jgi:molecular chaperone GrpE